MHLLVVLLDRLVLAESPRKLLFGWPTYPAMYDMFLADKYLVCRANVIDSLRNIGGLTVSSFKPCRL